MIRFGRQSSGPGPASSLPSLLTTSALLLVLSAPLAAQDPESREGYRTIPAHKLKSAPVGKRYSVVYLKFNKVFEDDLKVYGGLQGKRLVRARLEGKLKVRQKSKLHEALRVRKDSQGKALQPKISNIQVFGTLVQEGDERVLNVDRVLVLGTQLERFGKAAAALAPEDGTGRRELIRRIEYAVRNFPDDKQAVAELRASLLAEAREIAVAKLPELPEGAKARIDVGVAQNDIQLVSEVWDHPDVGDKERLQAEAGLRKLRAVRHHGHWVHSSEVKRELGFLVQERRWVRQERVWLEEGIAREKQRLADRQPRRDYSERDMLTYMKAGKIVRGMEKKWVIAARKAAGKKDFYPVHVERLREKREQQELIWELWVTADGIQLYFFNGWVTELLEGDGASVSDGDAEDDDPDESSGKTDSDEEPAKTDKTTGSDKTGDEDGKSE